MPAVLRGALITTWEAVSLRGHGVFVIPDDSALTFPFLINPSVLPNTAVVLDARE